MKLQLTIEVRGKMSKLDSRHPGTPDEVLCDILQKALKPDDYKTDQQHAAEMLVAAAMGLAPDVHALFDHFNLKLKHT